ncbi:MAG: UvrD-helicase domain-containing protein [Coriobacteriales bacterium]|jgi:DNA helicase-2/ATP-dependent DNA helicase PcrA|nr:UvrD-helicase domain-containing protein [Coriobacteriales bacterium]
MSIDLNVLNTEQRLAVECTEGPLLLLAGAGTGKTRALTYRIAHLIEDLGVSPYQILAITFTNKAAAEMRARLSQLLQRSGGIRGMWVATFHAMCVRMLRADAERLGYTRNFLIYDDDDSKRLMKEIYAELNIDVRFYAPNIMRERISKAKNALISSREFVDAYTDSTTCSRPKFTGYHFNESSKKVNLVARAYGALQDRLKRANAMDFDDLLFNTYNLLSKHADILEPYQQRFRYLLIDEYQDTNVAQYQIASLLAKKYRNIMVVGDDDQSIYSWRGADIRNILEFEKDYPDATVLKLEQNYRSTSTILKAANAVIANNSARKEKQLYTEGSEGNKIALYLASDERDEGRWIAGEIERLHKEGRPYSDFALFYRTNAQSRVLEDMALRAGLPYRIFGGTRFFDRAEIRDVMAYLKAVANPCDDIAIKRIINNPRRGIGKTSIAAIEHLAFHEKCTFFEACELMLSENILGKATCKALGAFLEMLRQARRYDGSLRDIVERIVYDSGLISSLLSEHTEEAQGRAENIQEFFGVAQEFAESHHGTELEDDDDLDTVQNYDAALGSTEDNDDLANYETANNNESSANKENQSQDINSKLAAFLEWLALRSDLDTLIEGESYVTLMTVHSAKGLEFPVVFIAGMENSIFPHIAAFDDFKGVEEERRLAYVAITRARELLYMTCAQTRSLFGKTSTNPQSRFITEIPDELLSISGIGSNAYLGIGTEKRGSRRGILGSGTGAFNGSGAYTHSVSGSVAKAGNGRRASNKAVKSNFKAHDAKTDGRVFGGGGFASNKNDDIVFNKGDEVDHKTFGRGKVIDVDGDALFVHFDKLRQTKKLLKGFAPLVRIK